MASDVTNAFTNPAEIEQLCSNEQSNRYHEEEPGDGENSKLWGSRRLRVVMFMFFGYIYLHMLNTNLSIAIVEMTSNKTIVIGNQTIIQAPEFSWNSQTKGWILSSFFYGYLFAVIGGYLATKWGGATVYGLGILTTALLTIMSPFTIRTNLYLFLAGRIAEGLFESFSYASSCDLRVRWMPKNEMPILSGLSFTGHHVGAAITFPILGYIAQHWGWPMIFYFSGIIALIWCVAFFMVVKNDPAYDKKISPGELEYIKRKVKCSDINNITYPWRRIFTSKPLWAVCINKCAFCWVNSILAICIPLYVKDLTNRNTAEVGVLSAIPNYANVIISPVTGIVINYLENGIELDPSKLHKRIMSFGYFFSGILFIIANFGDFGISMGCFVIIRILLSVNAVVIILSSLYIAPDHAGIVAGVSAFWCTLTSLGSPLAIGYIVTHHTWQEWRRCFLLSGGILMIAAVITLLFGSSEDQKWSSAEYQKAEEL